MKAIQLISPVDGSVYAERTPLSRDAAFAVADRAKAAQKAWAARPLADRIALVKAGVARLTAMKETVATELAHQMGRPIRYGQGEMGGVNARTDYMAEIAAETLAPTVIEDSDKFRRYIAREALGYEYMGDTNNVDVHIAHLRAKIEDAGGARIIQTVRGMGYVCRA